MERLIAGTGVEGIVLVQSQESGLDTEWLLAEAADAPIVAGVVGWIDPAEEDVARRVAELAELGPLVGLRVMAQDRVPDWLAAPQLHGPCACLSDRNLALDLLIRPQHLAASIALAARFPTLRIVIDHGAKPRIAEQGLAAWRQAMAPAADRPNLFCKLSGLATEAPPGRPLAELAPYVATLLDLFGPERLIWGSDWPVLNLASDYRAWLDFARSAIPEADRAKVFGGTASLCYRLDR